MFVGLISGNLSSGKFNKLILPTKRIMKAQTVEKTGRLIKNSTNIDFTGSGGVGEWEKKSFRILKERFFVSVNRKPVIGNN